MQGGATEDTAPNHAKWGNLVGILMAGLNRENGTIQSLPESGALLEQGHLAMQAFSVIQAVFIEHVNEANKPKGLKPAGA